jgi:hypothetical protein
MKLRFSIRNLLWLTLVAAMLAWGALRIASQRDQTPDSSRFLHEDNKLAEAEE